MTARPKNVPGGGIVLVRVALGLLLLSYGWGAVHAGRPDPAELEDMVRGGLDELVGLVASWGEFALLENPDAIAFLWSWGALSVGLLFLLGALVRLSGCLAALALTHAWVFGPAEYSSMMLFLAVCALACASSRAGNRLGLDPWLEQLLPSWLSLRGPKRSFLD